MGRNQVTVTQSTVAVNPSLTVLDQFSSKGIETVRLWLENTDAAQTLSVVLQTRPVVGAGTWGTQTSPLVDPVPALSMAGPVEVKVDGSGEVRVYGTASGAGLTCKYSRRNEMLVWPQQ